MDRAKIMSAYDSVVFALSAVTKRDVILAERINGELLEIPDERDPLTSDLMHAWDTLRDELIKPDSAV